MNEKLSLRKWFLFDILPELSHIEEKSKNFNIIKEFIDTELKERGFSLLHGYFQLYELFSEFKNAVECKKNNIQNCKKEKYHFEVNDNNEIVLLENNKYERFQDIVIEKKLKLEYIFLKLIKTDNTKQETYQNMQKLDWNGQQNVLYDLFRQLRNILGKDKQNPLLTNSVEEIALFLKQSFNNLENVKLSTITSELKNNSAKLNERPLSNKRIEINCK